MKGYLADTLEQRRLMRILLEVQWICFSLQELANILENLDSQRAAAPPDKDSEPDLDDEVGEDTGGTAAGDKAPLLQTFVFSATLTLPQKLRKRLRRGDTPCSGQGSSHAPGQLICPCACT